MTADEGLVFCDSINATLVRIDNTQENTFLASEMTKKDIQYIWLAANDRAVEGEWVWGPGDEVLNGLWQSGEPNDDYGEDCGVLKRTRQEWNDLNCLDQRPYAVCEARF
ncbi:C-type lectin domain family 17, member A-like [Pecten maximus]|uniref:C-type lectin domain family 17, member A-like n=1 Tax=Pecten maximus TaxID=6579 RepID=UPI0014584578|nr:C-type lectin domain family 17, member A-like [Pecten maximus]